MLRKLDANDYAPLYQQIKKAIVECIESGEWKAEEKIPTELELEQFFEVSRTTVRQAVTELIDEKYLYRRRGVGTFVADSAVRQKGTPNWFVTIVTSELIEINSRSPSRRILRVAPCPADQCLAERLGLCEGEPIIRLDRVQYGDDIPLSYMMTFIKPKYVPDLLKDQDLLEKGLHNYFKHCGHPVVEVHYDILAANVQDETILQALDLTKGSANLWVKSSSHLDDGSVIEVSDTIINSAQISIPITYRYN